MSDVLFCNNCGKLGHQYHQCKIPITSYGIIAFKILPDKTIQYLLIRRKDSLGYVDFIRGKYPLNNVEYLTNMIHEMTIEERNRISRQNFSTLWIDLWGDTCKSGSYQRIEEKISSDKLKQLKEGITISEHFYNLDTLIANSTSTWNEPEWGFPKGRRNYMENDMECALREWEEETGYSRKNLKLIKNLLPLEEIFTGSNYKSYKHKYYIAQFCKPLLHDNCDSFEKKEVGKMEWKNYHGAYLTIRSYNFEKKKLLQNLNHILSTYIL